jgi:enterochelin esterase-like enzyme
MRWKAPVIGAVIGLFTLVGLLSAFHYVDNYWLYRGFKRPRDPAFVRVHLRGDLLGPRVRVRPGTLLHLRVTSPALGGVAQPVLVYLPPGYASHPRRRYPTLYILHGVPGSPENIVDVGGVAVREDVLVAERRMQPLILVMPLGSRGFFGDTEWANGVGPADRWETFVAHDVVSAIDHRFRTIPEGWARGLAGLSEGGYGAINIGLHHPGEFGLIESWSGYIFPYDLPNVFAGDTALLRANDPVAELPGAAAKLRAAHTFVWFYTSHGRNRPQDEIFARELARLKVAHLFFLVRGPHNWSLWRRYMWRAMMAASRHLRPFHAARTGTGGSGAHHG